MKNCGTCIIEYAIKKNFFIGSDDFKSKQTKMKFVLVDFYVGAKIMVNFYFASLYWIASIILSLLYDFNLLIICNWHGILF